MVDSKTIAHSPADIPTHIPAETPARISRRTCRQMVDPKTIAHSLADIPTHVPAETSALTSQRISRHMVGPKDDRAISVGRLQTFLAGRAEIEPIGSSHYLGSDRTYRCTSVRGRSASCK
jgi:hypothetical protein